ncbi:MAG: hypothetical protein L0220_19995 [Acidobacteria bacterium]|nr:hypothetical protein [Acidobacteriota bacterium]
MSNDYKRKPAKPKHCSFCAEPLSAEEKKMNDYHQTCMKLFKQQTRSLSGVFSSLLYSARKRAEKKNWRYDLSSDSFDDTDGVEWLIEVYRKQAGKCAISGLEFLPSDDPEWSFHRTLSIDRIRSDVGYLRSNCQLVCQCVNYLKSNMSDEQVREIAEGIIETSEKRSRKSSRRNSR